MTTLDKILLVVAVVGLTVVSVSLFKGILSSAEVQVEYLETVSSDGDFLDRITVDIEGAVMSPGVYEMTSVSRVKDLIVAAGGFSRLADREYCEKNLNMAMLLRDSQKVYIPEIADTPGIPGYLEAKNTSSLVNVNTATVGILDTLQGVGEVRAEMIVKNRPYLNLEELVTKGGMTKTIFEKNKERLTL